MTAQRREEKLQDVPIAVQAFETQKLEELRIQDFEDYAKFLPNVSYQSFGPGFSANSFVSASRRVARSASDWMSALPISGSSAGAPPRSHL